MKTTLFLIGALAATCQMASAATVFTTTNSTASTVANAFYSGFRINLDTTLPNSRITTTADDASTPLPGQVKLDSIQTNIRATDGGAVFLAMTDRSGTVISMSTNSATATGSITWNFSDALLSTTSDCYFFFCNDGSATQVTLSNVVLAGATTLSSYGDTKGISSLSLIGDQTKSNWNTIYDRNFSIKLTMKTSSIAPVPEPTTATLGLIGLSGLLLRRRKNA